MSSVKKVNIEFFEEFCVASVEMSDGDKVTMVGVEKDGDVTWNSEAKSGRDDVESLASKVVFGCFASVVNAITE